MANLSPRKSPDNRDEWLSAWENFKTFNIIIKLRPDFLAFITKIMIIDCSTRIEANWNWETSTFISQSYKNNDEFQEFGLKWYGKGFTYITTPKWLNKNYKNLDNFDLNHFCGSAIIIEIMDKQKINKRLY